MFNIYICYFTPQNVNAKRTERWVVSERVIRKPVNAYVNRLLRPVGVMNAKMDFTICRTIICSVVQVSRDLFYELYAGQ